MGSTNKPAQVLLQPSGIPWHPQKKEKEKNYIRWGGKDSGSACAFGEAPWHTASAPSIYVGVKGHLGGGAAKFRAAEGASSHLHHGAGVGGLLDVGSMTCHFPEFAHMNM